MFNHHDISRDSFMLHGPLAHRGYDWWWHSFTAWDEITGEEKPFFIEFFVCNPALAEKKPVFGQLPANKEAGKLPSYLMVKAGCWGEDHTQLHRFFSLKEAKVYDGVPYRVSAGDCVASETLLAGSISVSKSAAEKHPEWMSDAGEITWNLKVDKQIAFNVGYGASKALRGAEAFAMYWHAEGMKSAYSGEITFNGRKYMVTPEQSYGYADKNWGRDFTSPWLWLSSNNLYSRVRKQKLTNSVFDIGGGRPRVFGIALDGKLLGGLFLEGREYDYNFSKPWLVSRQRFSFSETDDKGIWKVWLENKKSLLQINVICKKKDMLFINYVAPDASKKHDRLFNGGTGKAILKLYEKKREGLELIDVIEARNVGCEYGEYQR